jgi:hypothetical protein
VKSFVDPSWWWSGVCGRSGETFFNKWVLLWCCGILMLLLSPPVGHGGVERGWLPTMFCSGGGDWGVSLTIELIHTGGSMASTILCRQGGDYPTSDAEALRTHRGSSTALCHQVVRHRWLGDGQRLQFFVRREPSSNMLSFLGGDA